VSGGTGVNLDRDYLWEGDEMMYEDIVASTQPLNYNPAFLRKFDYFQNHHNPRNFRRHDDIMNQDSDLGLGSEYDDDFLN
jgi:hypothetical protein